MDRAASHTNYPLFRRSCRWRVTCISQRTASLIAHLRTAAAGRIMLSGTDLPMIQQTTPTGQASAKGLSPLQALVSLLIGRARADGSVSAHEASRGV